MKFVVTDARRTKNSIIFYMILTAALSAIFYVLVIHGSGGGRSPGSLILGLMWCPGISALVTRLAFQDNLRGLGLGWGQTKYQFATEFGAGLAIAALVVAAIFYAKREELPAQHLAESALQNSSIAAAVG